MDRLSLQQLIDDMDLPNPATPIPPKKFEVLAGSDDLMDRSAFWCFYAAFLVDKANTDTNTDGCEHTHAVSTPMAVQARQDGHIMNGISRQLSIRDCVLIQRHDLSSLTSQAESNRASEYFAYALIMVLILVGIGMVVWLVLHGIK